MPGRAMPRTLKSSINKFQAMRVLPIAPHFTCSALFSIQASHSAPSASHASQNNDRLGGHFRKGPIQQEARTGFCFDATRLTMGGVGDWVGTATELEYPDDRIYLRAWLDRLGCSLCLWLNRCM